LALEFDDQFVLKFDTLESLFKCETIYIKDKIEKLTERFKEDFPFVKQVKNVCLEDSSDNYAYFSSNKSRYKDLALKIHNLKKSCNLQSVEFWAYLANKIDFSDDFLREIDQFKLKLSSNLLNEFLERATHLTKLDISMSSDSKVSFKSNVFRVCRNLRELKLSIRELDENSSFLGLNNLEKLELSILKGLTKILNNTMFDDLCNIEELHINGSAVIFIQSGSFDKLKKLKKFYIKLKNLTMLYSNWFYNSGSEIKTLHIKCSQIKFTGRFNYFKSLNFFSPFRSFRNLNRLSMSNLHDNSLSFKEINLYSCFFSGLSDLHSLSWNLGEKSKLTFDSNLFFADFSCLKELNMSKSNLQTINKSIFKKMSSLESLNLNANSIESIEPETFSNLICLKRFELSGNKIKRLSELAFKGLCSLQYLDLSSNQIDSIDVNAFSSFSNSINYLDLSQNCVKSFADGLFSDMHNLNYLKLSNKSLEHLGKNLFTDLIGLECLNIVEEKIELLEPNTFQNLSMLIELKLNAWHLQNLHDISIFNGLENVERLEIFPFSQMSDYFLAYYDPVLLNRDYINFEFLALFQNLQFLRTKSSKVRKHVSENKAAYNFSIID
jgi:Leucine-rich repeat (LRR) protein